MTSKYFLPALAAACLFTLSALAQGPTPLLTQPAEKHLATLQSDAPRKARADACRELAVIGGPDAVPVLVGLLANPELHHMARYALETMPDPAVSDALRAQLGKLKGRLLVGVIGSLSVRKDVQAVEPIAKLLWDADHEVVQAAARALGRLGTPAALEALMNGIASAAPEDFPDFVEGIGRAVEALLAQGRTEQALELYDHHSDTDLPHHVRSSALRGALLARGAEGVPLLREVLRSPDYILFAAAVQTSFDMPGTPVTQALAEALPGLASPDHQVVVAGALGQRGDTAALPALTAAAGKGPKPVQLAALKALAMVGSEESVPTFLKFVNDGDREIAQAAREGLASQPGQAADDAVLKLLAGNSTPAQMAGLELVGRRRMAGSVPTLLVAARTGEPAVRVAALRQIGELGTEAEIAPVVDLLLAAGDEGAIAAGEQALIALAGRGQDAATVGSKVAAALTKAQPLAKAALLNVLAAIGGPGALKAVRAAAEDSNEEVRGAALRALSSWKTADAAPALLELATKAGRETDRRLALGGYLTLAGNSDLPADQRLEMCRHASSLIQRTEDKNLLLGALGQIPSPEALAMAVPYLDDTSTRTEAGAAVVAIADRLVRGEISASAAKALIEPLGKVAATVPNTELARRARNIADQARKKAGQ
jgi:HEAT repeat protein